MSDPRSKRYTSEQRAYMVEQYFRTSSYKIALGHFKKKFKEMPDSKTIQRVVEGFQTAYTLEDEPRSGRPHGSSTETVAFQVYKILKIDHEFLQFFKLGSKI